MEADMEIPRRTKSLLIADDRKAKRAKLHMLKRCDSRKSKLLLAQNDQSR